MEKGIVPASEWMVLARWASYRILLKEDSTGSNNTSGQYGASNNRASPTDPKVCCERRLWTTVYLRLYRLTDRPPAPTYSKKKVNSFSRTCSENVSLPPRKEREWRVKQWEIMKERRYRRNWPKESNKRSELSKPTKAKRTADYKNRRRLSPSFPRPWWAEARDQ